MAGADGNFAKNGGHADGGAKAHVALEVDQPANGRKVVAGVARAHLAGAGDGWAERAGEGASGGGSHPTSHQPALQVSPEELKAALASGAGAFLESVSTFIEDRSTSNDPRLQTQRSLMQVRHSPTLRSSPHPLHTPAPDTACWPRSPQITRAITLTLEWRSLTYKITMGRGKKRKERVRGGPSPAATGGLLLLVGCFPKGCGGP